MKSDALKQLAQRAKNRMIHKGLRNSYINSNIRIIDLETPKREFYNKVKALLLENRDMTNPLGRLIDKEKYMKLDEAGRERYLFQITEMYLEAKKKIEDELDIG